MATTGFWPVKNRLKEVIDYAENPSKTTDRSYLDDDLYKALSYVENDKKTDKKMYVTAINCPTKLAYQYMTATKKKYGKTGGNVAYHGYQSFRKDEVTAQEAHQIGLETAKRMWGDEYEIVVTTHLNTDNIHNHIVINSVSFKTGRKFENHRSDHYKLREISDSVCRERGKSVLPPQKFTGSTKKDYWVHKDGNLTHRDCIKRDMEAILQCCTNTHEFERKLKLMGYRFVRDNQYAHLSIIAEGWKRPVRLDSIGYSMDEIRRRLDENRHTDFRTFKEEDIIHVYHIVKHYPLLSIEKRLDYNITHSKDTGAVLVDLIFLILIELIKLTKDMTAQSQGVIPYSPMIRQSVAMEKQLVNEYSMLKVNDIHTQTDLLDFIDNRLYEIQALEKERVQIRNSNRRPKSKEEREFKNAQAREISKKIKPLRKDLKLAQNALERFPHVWNILRNEQEAEQKQLYRTKNKERGI